MVLSFTEFQKNQSSIDRMSPLASSLRWLYELSLAVAAEATNTSGTSSPPGLTKTAQSQDRVEMNSYPGHSDQSASNQSAHEIDDAMSTSSGSNSPPPSGLLSKHEKFHQMCLPNVENQTKEYPLSFLLENEAMNRELYTPRKSHSSGRERESRAIKAKAIADRQERKE